MPSSRTLILKGILGVAGLGVTGAGGIGLGLGKTFSEGQKDQTSKDSSSKSGDAGGIVTVKDADLGIPKECVTTCVLTAEQLKKLKFEKSGNEEITFEGLKDGDEFELTIEDSEDQTNYPKGKKYTLKPKTISGTVTIKNIKEEDIVLENSKEVLIREISSGGKLEHLLEEVTELGIPKRCVSEQATTECDLTQLQLQKLKFETRDGSSITVDGLTEGNIVTLKIEDKKDDINNYPRGKKYTLRSESGEVTIKGVKEEDIVLGKDQEVLIRETISGGKLEHLLEEVDRLGIPKKCKADEVKDGTPKKCVLIKKQLKDLKFEPKEGSSITVEDQNEKITFELTIEDKPNDKDNYPLGKKYTLTSKGSTEKITKIKGVKERDIGIWGNQSVVIREKQEGGKLEMAPGEVDELGIPKSCAQGGTCHLTEQQLEKLKFETKDNEKIKVEFPDNAKTVILKVENKSNEKENYPKGKKYTLTLKTGTVTIKNLKEGDITVGKEGVVIREKEEGGKLEKAPEEIDNLGIPRSCISGTTCHLTREQFEKLKFETSGASSISVEGLTGNNTVDLKVTGVTGDIDNYPKWKKYTLKSTSGTVTIRGAKDGNIVLKENKAVDFREIKAGNRLETSLDVLGIPRGCKAEEIRKGSTPETCYLSSDQLKELRFKVFEEKTGEVKVEGLDRGETIKLIISWDKDTNNYPDNRKYSFDNRDRENKDIKIIKDGVEVKIAKKSESRFKNNEGQLELVESKDKEQIARESELTELRGILEKLGLEKLQIGNIKNNYSPKIRNQTYVEFKNVEELKKIQFKEFNGGADYTSHSTFSHFQKIMVYLDWDANEKKFPKNMKITLENNYFDVGGGFIFRKTGKNPIIIFLKDSKKNNADNRKNVFKVEKQGKEDKWYLVRTEVK